MLSAIILSLGLYANTMTITELVPETNTVMCEDSTGNIWEFSGIEDYEEGDQVSCILTDNGTENIEDDVILLVRYTG